MRKWCHNLKKKNKEDSVVHIYRFTEEWENKIKQFTAKCILNLGLLERYKCLIYDDVHDDGDDIHDDDDNDDDDDDDNYPSYGWSTLAA